MRAPIHDFREFCLVDLGLAEASVQIHVREITKFLHYMKRKRGSITRKHIRHYLMPCRRRPNVKRKILAALKRYFRDYLEQPDLMKSFKFPSSRFRPKQIANKDMLQAFFPHLPCEEAKLIFLFYATSGLRRSEA